MEYKRSELDDVIGKVNFYLSVNRFDAAEKLLRATLVDFGSAAHLHNLLGAVFHRQSRFREAIGEFEKSFAENPRFIEAGLNLAATLCDLSRYEEARAVFSKVFSQSTKSPGKHVSLVLGRIANQHVESGRAYEKIGYNQEALQEYRRSLTLYEDMPDIRLRIAKIFLRTGQLDRARAELEELVKREPNLGQAQMWLGVALFNQGKVREAKQFWEKAKHQNDAQNISRAYIRLADRLSR